MPFFRAAVIFAILIGALPCAAQSQDACDKAYAGKHWSDVLETCPSIIASDGHEATTSGDLSKDDRLLLYEALVAKSLYVAQAYQALEDSRMAEVSLKQADLWLQIAQAAGLGTDSAQYKSLHGAIEQTRDVATPSPNP
jgi:hypothetical protein